MSLRAFEEITGGCTTPSEWRFSNSPIPEILVKDEPQPLPRISSIPLRILVVDDEPSLRAGIRAILQRDGYEVVEAADGKEALEKVISSVPDLMILDLNMPRMDGLSALAELSPVHGQLKPKVIVLTSFASPLSIMKGIGLGANLVLQKPISADDLRSAINRVLKAPEDQDFGIPIDWSENLPND